MREQPKFIGPQRHDCAVNSHLMRVEVQRDCAVNQPLARWRAGMGKGINAAQQAHGIQRADKIIVGPSLQSAAARIFIRRFEHHCQMHAPRRFAFAQAPAEFEA